MNIIQCEQGSEEWYQARLGKITGTGFAKVLAKGKGITRDGYMYDLCAERLTGVPTPHYVDKNMDWGTENEPAARRWYEQVYGVSVVQVGFVEMNDDTGCSPDGLVGNDGMIQIKCPKTVNHLKMIENSKIEGKYLTQIQGELWVCERKWSDYVSYDPRMKANKGHVVRVHRDDSFMITLDAETKQFLTELRKLVKGFEAPF